MALALKFKTLKEINVAIDKIAKTGKTYQKEVHDTAIQAMLWTREHGDVTALTRLAFALPGAARGESFKTWVKAFIPATWVKKEALGKITEGFVLNKGRAKDFSDFLIGEADAKPFWEYERDVSRADMVMDFNKWLNRLSSFAAQMQKAIEEGKVPAEQIPAVRQFHDNVVNLYHREEKVAEKSVIVAKETVETADKVVKPKRAKAPKAAKEPVAA